jgi:hypothetical protein
VPDMTVAQPAPPLPREEAMELYARQTRNAALFIAWVVGLIFVITLVIGIIAGVELAHIAHASTGTDCYTAGTC